MIDRKNAPWFAVCYVRAVTAQECPDGCPHAAGDPLSFGQMTPEELAQLGPNRVANSIVYQPALNERYDPALKRVVRR